VGCREPNQESTKTRNQKLIVQTDRVFGKSSGETIRKENDLFFSSVRPERGEIKEGSNQAHHFLKTGVIKGNQDRALSNRGRPAPKRHVDVKKKEKLDMTREGKKVPPNTTKGGELGCQQYSQPVPAGQERREEKTTQLYFGSEDGVETTPQGVWGARILRKEMRKKRQLHWRFDV